MLQLPPIILDVLEDIDVKQGVEERPRRDLAQGPDDDLARPRQFPPLHRLAESLSQISVRLEADPGILSWGAQELRRPPHSGADFQGLGAQEGLDMAAKIRLPDGRRGEQPSSVPTYE